MQLPEAGQRVCEESGVSSAPVQAGCMQLLLLSQGLSAGQCLTWPPPLTSPCSGPHQDTGQLWGKAQEEGGGGMG